jgi:hypothetical protein
VQPPLLTDRLLRLQAIAAHVGVGQ